MKGKSRILLIGYGNPGRLDDGLGPALAAEAEKWNIPGLTVESDYQLTVEDAELVARHETVIFADASVNGAEPFALEWLEPKPTLSFSTHSVEAAAVLGLAHQMFGAKTAGYVLGIRGYMFDAFEERLSDKAKENLRAAAEYMKKTLSEGSLPENGVHVN
ncbi:hydrogenase maturation protease [bacterium]|nr:hydrogenase maturation protease [bacterium]